MTNADNIYNFLCRKGRRGNIRLALWYELLSCHVQVERQLARRLKQEFGITLPNYDVLCVLSQFDSGLTLTELAKFLMVSNPNITGIITRLHKMGLITRKLKPSDRRTTIVKLSKKGIHNWGQMENLYREIIVENIFQDISKKEIQMTYNRLKTLNASLNITWNQ